MEYRSVSRFPEGKVRVGDDGSIQTYHSRWKKWITLKPFVWGRNLCVSIRGIEAQTTFTVAPLVCLAFHGPRPIGHIPFRFPDKDPSNCQASNLRWAPIGTQSLGRHVAHGGAHLRGLPTRKGSACGASKLTETEVAWARRQCRDGWKLSEIAMDLDVSTTTIQFAVRGKTWRHVKEEPYIGPLATAHFGAFNASSKLDDEKVRKAREMRRGRFTVKQIADSLGVGETTIAYIFKGRTWSHVADDDSTPIPNARVVPCQQGISNPSAKINEEIVRRIRRLRMDGRSYGDIQRELGLPRNIVSFVASGRTWSHVSD